jgi:hypothetical protein
MTEYNRPLDVIDALTMEFLRFYNPAVTYNREVSNPALVVYTIDNYEYGELGTIRLRKIGEQFADVSFTLPPIPEIGDNYKPSPLFRSWLVDNHPGILSIPETTEFLAQDTVIQILKLYQEWLYPQRQAAQQILIQAYQERLYQEQQLNVPAETLGEEPEKPPEPWEKIPDHLWDRLAVKMWREGYTNKDIGEIVFVSPRRVTNRLSELRMSFGTDIVPTNEMRRHKEIFKENS